MKVMTKDYFIYNNDLLLQCHNDCVKPSLSSTHQKQSLWSSTPMCIIQYAKYEHIRSTIKRGFHVTKRETYLVYVNLTFHSKVK